MAEYRNRIGWAMPNRFESLSENDTQSGSDDQLSWSTESSVERPSKKAARGFCGPDPKGLDYINKFSMGLPRFKKTYTVHSFLKEAKNKTETLPPDLRFRKGDFYMWPERPFVDFAVSSLRLENAAYSLAEGAIRNPHAERGLVRRTLKALLYGYDYILGYLRYPKGKFLRLPRSLKNRVFQALRLLGNHR